MFGWNDSQPVSVEEKQNLLAHEMVHNWPHLNDNPYGVTTWYAEGTAEYYSIMIPLRNGLITAAEALAEIQKRTDAYYTNPHPASFRPGSREDLLAGPPGAAPFLRPGHLFPGQHRRKNPPGHGG